MLTITVGAIESFDYDTNEFTSSGGVVVNLEHSLVSLSKWESIHCKSFISGPDKSPEEMMDYVRCMIISPFTPDIFEKLSDENFKEIDDYINESQTATWFNQKAPAGGRNTETITAELIYYWMFQHSIPIECEHWHINRLTTLIKVCNAKSQPPKKMSRAEAAAQRRELNAQRRKQLGTSG